LGELLRRTEPTAIEQIRRADIDVQISTAHAYPRDVARATANIRQMALSGPEAAEKCYYVLERKDRRTGKVKKIQGPSIRLAEIVAAEWGNMHVGTRILEEGQRTITVQGAARDLQSNLTVESEVTRRITTSDGSRYGDDMIGVTIMAASSIAFRNVVFKVVPQVVWSGILEEAMAISERPNGDGRQKNDATAKTELATKIATMTRRFDELGVTPEQILAKVDKGDMADLDFKDIARLRGIYTAIRDGMSTAEEEFAADVFSAKDLAIPPPEPQGSGRTPRKSVAMRSESTPPQNQDTQEGRPEAPGREPGEEG